MFTFEHSFLLVSYSLQKHSGYISFKILINAQQKRRGARTWYCTSHDCSCCRSRSTFCSRWKCRAFVRAENVVSEGTLLSNYYQVVKNFTRQFTSSPRIGLHVEILVSHWADLTKFLIVVDILLAQIYYCYFIVTRILLAIMPMMYYR